jgi:hypothetical protein
MINKKMTKWHMMTICETVGLFTAIGIICYILRRNTPLPVSIDSAWNYFSHLAKHFHVIAAALLPVYVALMIFGTAALGMYVGSFIQRRVTQALSVDKSRM